MALDEQSMYLAVEGDCRGSCSDGDAACAAVNSVPSSRTAEANACQE
jgi:hypothetical protein